MKFTPLQINVLKNFGSINPNQFVYQDKLLTYGFNASIAAHYKTTIDLPVEKIAFYDVREFLNILSSFGEDYDIEVTDNFLKIKDGDRTVNYILSTDILKSQEFPLAKFDEIFAIKNPDIEFTLDQEKVAIITKIIGIMQLNKIFLDYNYQLNRLSFIVEKEHNISMNNYIQGVSDFKVNDTIKENQKIFIEKDDFLSLYKGVDYKVTLSCADTKVAKIFFKTDLGVEYTFASKFAGEEY